MAATAPATSEETTIARTSRFPGGVAAPSPNIGSLISARTVRITAATACQERKEHAHAGLPPIMRLTTRETMSTVTTSSAASTEPMTSAAHMSIVWL